MTLVRLYLIGFGLYGVVVVVGMVAASRQIGAGPHTRLVREVSENQWIEDADVASIDQGDIVRHYARRHMTIGEGITPDDVAAKQTPSPKPSLAIFVSYKKAARRKPLTAGDTVRVCLDSTPLSLDAMKILTVDCGADACTIIVPVPAIPKSLRDQDALSRLRVVDASDDCKGG